jgi:hypothetical protein
VSLGQITSPDVLTTRKISRLGQNFFRAPTRRLSNETAKETGSNQALYFEIAIFAAPAAEKMRFLRQRVSSPGFR